MVLIMIVNPELGWDSVVAAIEGETVTTEQYERLEEICEENNYILIDWKSTSSVESFLRDYE